MNVYTFLLNAFTNYVIKQIYKALKRPKRDFKKYISGLDDNDIW